MLEKFLIRFDCKEFTNKIDTSNELLSMLRARVRLASNGHDPPKICVIGPPGSGRSL